MGYDGAIVFVTEGTDFIRSAVVRRLLERMDSEGRNSP